MTVKFNKIPELNQSQVKQIFENKALIGQDSQMTAKGLTRYKNQQDMANSHSLHCTGHQLIFWHFLYNKNFQIFQKKNNEKTKKKG